MKLLHSALTLAVLCLLAAPTLGDDAAQFDTAWQSILAADAQRHVETLADDTFEGRSAGSRGGRAAAGYLVKQLREYGLQPAGSGGDWYQSFGAGYRNVLAKIEGSDPELKAEYVVLGAHYDHVGYGRRGNSYGPFGYIHNGADDNASGTSALLEIAQAYSQAKLAPRRSILFAFWDAEESGLLGSRHWVRSPTVSLNRIKFNINLDMVGRLRNNKVEILGSRTGYGLRRLVSRYNPAGGLKLDYTWKLKSNSDHAPFYERSIPVLLAHTGKHPDYHRPTDDVEKINYEGIQRVARLVLHIADDLANRDQITGFRSRSRSESNYHRRQFETRLPSLPPRLGVTWVEPEEDAEEQGLQLATVVAGSPAAAAGLLPGDRLLAVSGEPLASGPQLRAVVLHAKSTLPLTVERTGEEEPLKIEVTLGGRPIRIGISWREDNAEPGVALISRVVSGSPASVAGLRVGDRITLVDGKVFSQIAAFREYITAAIGLVELDVDRNGQMHVMTMTLPPMEPAASEPQSLSLPAPVAGATYTARSNARRTK